MAALAFILYGGAPYNVHRCAQEVEKTTRNRKWRRQCGRTGGHGPFNLYCAQHATLIAEGKLHATFEELPAR